VYFVQKVVGVFVRFFVRRFQKLDNDFWTGRSGTQIAWQLTLSTASSF
jgi:hypothetical protein